uniref:uncharacterized protein isoform X2 n=1 Tax=Myxine glutinosa TaxID=7769 RepID=UPI00358EA988
MDRRTFVFEVTKHMHSLRTQFARYSKQISRGIAGKQKTRRQEWLLKNLNFLAPHLRKRTSLYDLYIDEDLNEDIDVHGTKEESEDETVHSENPVMNAMKQPPTPIFISAKRRKEEREQEELAIMRSVAKALQEPETKPMEEDDDDDDDAVFAKYIMREMRQIKDPKSKAVLKNTIHNVIFQAQIGALQHEQCQMQSTTQLCSSVPKRSQTKCTNHPSRVCCSSRCHDQAHQLHPNKTAPTCPEDSLVLKCEILEPQHVVQCKLHSPLRLKTT